MSPPVSASDLGDVLRALHRLGIHDPAGAALVVDLIGSSGPGAPRPAPRREEQAHTEQRGATQGLRGQGRKETTPPIEMGEAAWSWTDVIRRTVDRYAPRVSVGVPAAALSWLVAVGLTPTVAVPLVGLVSVYIVLRSFQGFNDLRPAVARRSSDEAEAPPVHEGRLVPASATVGPFAAGAARPLARRGDGVPPSAPPLINERRARTAFAGVVAEVVPDGPVDLARVTRMVAQGRAPTVVPRRPRRSTRAGVQVLVDGGRALEPFQRDVTDVVADLRDLVGDDALRVRHLDPPMAAGRRGGGVEADLDRWAAPGAAVLVVCDLGVAPTTGRRSPATWIDLAARIEERGGRPLFLVPQPSHRWPAETVKAGLRILWWDDRGTGRW